MTYQTRSETTGILYHRDLASALEYASNNPDVWKVSVIGELEIRLIRTSEGWTYEDIFGNRYK